MKQAVVLLNMGGIGSMDEVRLFLENMFNDENILSIKPAILRGFVARIIASRREPVARENYKKIGGKSPLNGITQRVCEKLSFIDTQRKFYAAMRYLPPFAKEVVEKIQEDGIEEVILFSMYPHYSRTTTKSSIDDFLNSCRAANYTPKITIIDRYFDNKLYNLAVIDRIKEALKGDRSNDFTLIFSAHGLPQRVINKGDPYQKEIEENINLLKEMLKSEGLLFKSIELGYQSKVGPLKWLEPSLKKVLGRYKNEKVIIYPLSFTIDNSESVLELDIEYRDEAKRVGVSDFRVCKCLNDSPLFIEAILSLCSKS